MKRLSSWILPALLLTVLAACSPPRKSMYPPTVSVQQLHVKPDGRWHMQMRILNNSYGSMDFRALHLTMTINNQPATSIDADFELEIPALSADITEVTIQPSAEAAHALAAIADKGSSGALAYTLQGIAGAIPEKSDKTRDFKVESHDWLSAVPGVADTYR